jgi:uncharacterized damage-inducible protein DinB
MDLRALTHLLTYHHWATSRLLQTLSVLPPDALDHPTDGSFGTPRALLAHMLGAEEVWMERLNGRSPRALPDHTSGRAVADIQAAWEAVQAAQRAFIRGPGSERLEESVSYTNFRGETWAYSLEAVLLHVVNHGTYHRGQLAHVLRQLGQMPPSTDYLVFMEEMAAGPADAPSVV